MIWLRIGHLEIYKIPSSFFIDNDSVCGCRMAGIGSLGVTWLGDECRNTQGSEFIKVYNMNEESEEK